MVIMESSLVSTIFINYGGTQFFKESLIPRYHNGKIAAGLLETVVKALECITSGSSPSTAGQRVLLTITGPGILINFKQSSGPKGDDVL